MRRRDFLAATLGASACAACRTLVPAPRGAIVNDVHSGLNATRVARILTPRAAADVADAITDVRRTGGSVAICGSRHAMGGQQFCTDETLLDLRAVEAVSDFDAARGHVEIGAGAEWPGLYAWLRRERSDWGVAQKQTGADCLTLGGALSANVHGRGLRRRPFVQDVEAFTLIDSAGRERRCSRAENPGLFRAAIGGYGGFGAITSVRLRLVRRHKVRRTVAIVSAQELPGAFARRLREGYEFGDWQFAIAADAPEFLDRGVFSCYRPVADETPFPEDQARFSAEKLNDLLLLAHTDPRRGFAAYCDYYRGTDGQLYWSDEHQLGAYTPGYHRRIDAVTRAGVPGSEMITEIYVPRGALPAFLRRAAATLRVDGCPVIYGTVRLIERDDETLLAWARERWACVIFNLHVEHHPSGLARAAAAFRHLIDCGLAFRGSYYLTYHRWATARQMLAAHPRLPAFFAAQAQHDPAGVFQSDWSRDVRARVEKALRGKL